MTFELADLAESPLIVKNTVYNIDVIRRAARTPEISNKAMDRLVSQGVLERRETGGCRVASLAKEDISDAIDLRGVIEEAAARLAAERGVDRSLLRKSHEALGQIGQALNGSGG